MKNEPIIIIGAGRSGTNILRDTLCRLTGLKTWPCDEINYIWRHGNIRKESDRFTTDNLTLKIQKFIQRKFDRFEKSSNAEFIIEKTCANSLRVPFINSIFPNAKYIFIIRNGFDVASSAKLRWTASLELKYIFKKAAYIPTEDIPYYGFRYFINRIKKLFSKEKRLSFWGPLYPDMKYDLKRDSLIEVCAKQWRACTETAYNDLRSLTEGRVHYLKYEDFVTAPLSEMQKIARFLGIEFTNEELKKVIGKVSSKSVGSYKRHLAEEEIIAIKPIVAPVMEDVYQKV